MNRWSKEPTSNTSCRCKPMRTYANMTSKAQLNMHSEVIHYCPVYACNFCFLMFTSLVFLSTCEVRSSFEQSTYSKVCFIWYKKEYRANNYRTVTIDQTVRDRYMKFRWLQNGVIFSGTRLIHQSEFPWGLDDFHLHESMVLHKILCSSPISSEALISGMVIACPLTGLVMRYFMTIRNSLGFDVSSPLTLNEWIFYTLYLYKFKVSSHLDFTKNRIVWFSSANR